MQPDQVLRHFEESGAILKGHFRLRSGLHSDTYLQSALVLQHPDRAEELCKALASIARDWDPQVVVGPALGAVVMAYELARQLSLRGVFAERENGKMTLRRGFKIAPRERVLLAEDVVTKAGSIAEVAALVESAGGKTVGAACLVDRSLGVELGFPLRSLLKLSILTYFPERCPLCQEGLPLETPGSSYLGKG